VSEERYCFESSKQIFPEFGIFAFKVKNRKTNIFTFYTLLGYLKKPKNLFFIKIEFCYSDMKNAAKQ